jgi:hypothetical protein
MTRESGDAQVARSLQSLERFPIVGPPLTGRWGGFRFLLGPWRWLLIVYLFLEPDGPRRRRNDPGRALLRRRHCRALTYAATHVPKRRAEPGQDKPASPPSDLPHNESYPAN